MKRIYLLLLLNVTIFYGYAQKKPAQQNTATVYDTSLFNAMHWRCIGPFRGGRSLAVCGISTQANVYYAGAVGGGVWKTIDGGQSWICISDTTFHSSSVGAISVAPSDANIVYVGMGESEMRGNVSFGDGVYKSMDAGKTWKHMGLNNSYAISTIIVHPQNADLLYVCAMGKTFGANSERGLYRSKDGGKIWERVLFRNDSTGCVSVSFDPSNPRTMYATLWQAYRNRYSLSSGGKGSGLYKSDDGGETWKNISENPGLPVGLTGKIKVCTSAAKPERVYASVENENGGIFRSDDRGEHWTRTSDDRNLRKRPWYFSTIVADPQNADVIYCLNVQFYKSTDGGAKFTQLNNPHGDNHEMWIDPVNPKRFILGDDGGPWVTIDGGITYTEADLPTAQFYHVNLDNDFPYHVYGAQQDNSSVRISSGTNSNTIGKQDWFPVAGGEAGYIVPDPKNSDITIGGEYCGYLSMYNKKNEQYKIISVYPETVYGAGAESKKFRFNWTYPITFSPHNSDVLYVCSQNVHRSTNHGDSWETISPDLTRHDTSTIKPSGGPI
ncbi:MAG: glycosyl hydrolase, partial [Bacteroidia bacterium]|nr:glycosyl hydrolase [Bacteroidia bacterium]